MKLLTIDNIMPTVGINIPKELISILDNIAKDEFEGNRSITIQKMIRFYSDSNLDFEDRLTVLESELTELHQSVSLALSLINRLSSA